MTEKQFWRRIEKHGGDPSAVLEVANTLRQAYDQNLGVICGCRHIGPDIVNQMYVNVNEDEPNRNGNRYMLCYTSRAMANADPLLTEPCEKVSVRFVIDNALNKPVIGGLLFNRHSKNPIIVPKQFLDDRMYIDVIKRFVNNDPNPLDMPLRDK